MKLTTKSTYQRSATCQRGLSCAGAGADPAAAAHGSNGWRSPWFTDIVFF